MSFSTYLVVDIMIKAIPKYCPTLVDSDPILIFLAYSYVNILEGKLLRFAGTILPTSTLEAFKLKGNFIYKNKQVLIPVRMGLLLQLMHTSQRFQIDPEQISACMDFLQRLFYIFIGS